ncbi:hypothetical protein ZOSMA_13G00710 [Zostera marina]|uniref:Uncharacterized protein n=1 Tax=Zostera marina TaxID=29655 RepID=A0A0K9Q038_ZOSMR|nr:hypothetical protein ZOSMA_13G00710 [Zostera marina]
MELPLHSIFRLQLLTLISRTRDLREKERRTREELDRSLQREKEIEIEFGRKERGMQMELDARDESLRKLDSKMKYLENENMLMERKHKELKDSIDELLESKEIFLKNYKDSYLSMQRVIATRDRKIAVLSDKIHAHFLLLDLIRKEAMEVNQTVDKTQTLVTEKEKVVVELKEKMEKVSITEKDLIRKIAILECKHETCVEEHRKKDATIFLLKEQKEVEKNTSLQLQIEKISFAYQDHKCMDKKIILLCNQTIVFPYVENLQKALTLKEHTIANLTSDKQTLQYELRSLEISLNRIQETFNNITPENKDSMMVLEGKDSNTINERKDKRLPSDASSFAENSFSDCGRQIDENAVPMLYEEQNAVSDLSFQTNVPISNSFVSEDTYTSPSCAPNEG